MTPFVEFSLPGLNPVFKLRALQFILPRSADGPLERWYGFSRQFTFGTTGPVRFFDCQNLFQTQVMITPLAAKTMVKTTYSMVIALLRYRVHGVIDVTQHAVIQPIVTRPCDRAVKDVQFPFDPCRITGPSPGPVRVNTPRYFPCACPTTRGQVLLASRRFPGGIPVKNYAYLVPKYPQEHINNIN